MTEIAKIPKITAIYPFAPTAFFVALFLAPVVFAVATFWVALIPVFAVVVGYLPYIIIGGPILLWAVGRVRPHPLVYGLIALGAEGLLWLVARFRPDLIGVNDWYFALGAFFAFFWGMTFAILYGRWHPDPTVFVQQKG